MYIVKILSVDFSNYVRIKWLELEDNEESGLQPMTHNDFVEFITKVGFNPEKHDLYEWVNNEFIGKSFKYS